MFSWSEIVFIAVVALIFIGPKELPAVLHKLGQGAAKLRRSADEFRRHFEESMREAGYEDLHKNINELRALNPSSHLRATIDNVLNQSPAPRPQPAGTLASTPSSFAAAPVAAADVASIAQASPEPDLGLQGSQAEQAAIAMTQGVAMPGGQEAAAGLLKASQHE